MKKNRRQHTRIPKRMQVEYGKEGLTQKGFLRDISIGGIYLLARRIFEVGTRLHLHILAPKDDFFIEGVVAHGKRVATQLQAVEDQGMGIRFLSPPELIRSVVPIKQRTINTHQILCESNEAVIKILSEQLNMGVLIVPVTSPAPTVNTVVEFQIVASVVSPPLSILGTGRVVQLLQSGEQVNAVIEVQEVAKVRSQLATAVSV